MKFLIALIIIIPSLIAVLLFSVAGFAYSAPEMLVAAENPTIAICCIIAGIIAMLPLVAAIVVWIVNIISSSKKK